MFLSLDNSPVHPVQRKCIHCRWGTRRYGDIGRRPEGKPTFVSGSAHRKRRESNDLVFDLWKPGRILAGSLLHRVRLVYNDTDSPRQPVVLEGLVKPVDDLSSLSWAR